MKIFDCSNTDHLLSFIDCSRQHIRFIQSTARLHYFPVYRLQMMMPHSLWLQDFDKVGKILRPRQHRARRPLGMGTIPCGWYSSRHPDTSRAKIVLWISKSPHGSVEDDHWWLFLLMLKTGNNAKVYHAYGLYEH